MSEDVRRNRAATSWLGADVCSAPSNGFQTYTIAGGGTPRFAHKRVLNGICTSGIYMPLRPLGAGGRVLEWDPGGADDHISTATDTSRSRNIPDVRVQAYGNNIHNQLTQSY